MKKLLLLLLPAALAFSSCGLFTNYGKKITVGESEVFYKGDGVTKAEAEKVGDFLVENKLFDKKNRSSAQLTSDGDTYIVHLVMDAKNMTPSLRLNMWRIQTSLSKEVFDGKDARFAFTDDKFNDDEVLDPVNEFTFGKASIIYDNSVFTKSSVKKLADLLQEKGLISEDKEANVLLRKEDNVPVVRIIVNKEYIDENKETILPAFGYWQYLMQNNLSFLKNAKFWLTTTTYEDYKKVPKINEEEVAKFEAEENNNSQDNTNTGTTTVDTTNTQLNGIPAPQNQ